MTARIPLPDDKQNPWGLPDTSSLAPAIGAARQGVARAAHRMKAVHPVTAELVRVRNARYQQCFF